jgi:hypothetical protein
MPLTLPSPARGEGTWFPRSRTPRNVLIQIHKLKRPCTHAVGEDCSWSEHRGSSEVPVSVGERGAAQATDSEAWQDVKAMICELPQNRTKKRSSQLELERDGTSDGSERERQRTEGIVLTDDLPSCVPRHKVVYFLFNIVLYIEGEDRPPPILWHHPCHLE